MNKKVIAIFALILMFSLSHIAHADTIDCSVVSCGGGNPALLVGGWGTSNSGVPAVSMGQTVTDDLGMSSTCQFSTGCVDIYHTAWYENLISALKIQLGTTGFQYWVSLMKNK